MSVIVDIEGIDFDKANVILVNGLTLEKIKIKYNWLLNSKVKDAIVGEDARGIVWYFGDWYCGEWLDGTWYSGNFYDGIWKNGLFYSYKLEKFDIVNEKFFIKQTGDQYSQFHNGYWITGTFYGGTFGVNSGESWTYLVENTYVPFELYTEGEYPNYRVPANLEGGNINYLYKKLAIWVDGIYQNGLFYDAIWCNGQHINGYMQNSKWINGSWYNGTFNGDTWHIGSWYNGEFIKGEWLDGTFTKLNPNINSRFGNTLLDTDNNTAICNWYNGTWYNGDWFSGYNTINNIPIESSKNYLSIWHDGTWNNGNWYGGHFKKGTWNNGIWKNGVFGHLNSTNWSNPTLVSQDSTFLGANWISDYETPSTENNTDNITTKYSSGSTYEFKYYDFDIIGCNINLIVPTPGLTSITFNQSTPVTFNYDNYDTYTTTTTTTKYDFNYIHDNMNYEMIINGNNILKPNITSVSIDVNNIWTINIDSPISVLSNNTLTFKVKMDTSLKSGGGKGTSYLDYYKTDIFTSGSTNYLSFISTDINYFNVGDFVSILQYKNSINTSYNGIAKVLQTGITSNNEYYIVTSKKYKNNTTDIGKIVSFNNNLIDRPFIQSPSLFFQDLDFIFTDVDTDKINGYSIKYDVFIDNDFYEHSGYLHGSVWLPVKKLVLTGVDLTTPNNPQFTYSDPLNGWDAGWYDPSLYQHTSTNLINIDNAGQKRKNGTLNNLLDGNKNTYYYGGYGDLWDLSGLTMYYSYNNNFNENNYNVTLTDTATNKLRIALNCYINGTIDQKIYISNVQIKAYYSDETIIPIWNNGTWYKGTWYNGDFYDGSFISGLWIKGNFYGGNLSSNYR